MLMWRMNGWQSVQEASDWWFKVLPTPAVPSGVFHFRLFIFVTLLCCWTGTMVFVQSLINVLSLSCWGGKCLAQLKHERVGCMQNHAWTDPFNMKSSLACHTGLSNNGLFDEVEAIVQSSKGGYTGQDNMMIKIAYWPDSPIPDKISRRPEHWLFQRLSCQIVLWFEVC